MEKKKATTISLAVLCIVSATVVATTYALFSDNGNVNNHLKAGTLKVGLKRVQLTKPFINELGKVENKVNTKSVDLVSNESTLFNLENVVPTYWEESKISVANLGDLDFNYGVRLLWNIDNKATDLETSYASQLEATITSKDGETMVFLLKDCKTNDFDLGMLKPGKSETFDIKIKFLDREANNAVETLSLDFDLQVYAQQAITYNA